MIHPGDQRKDFLRGICHVSVRAFENLELGVLLSSTKSASYSGRLLGASEADGSASAADLEGLAESRVEGPRCVRGIIVGIGMEVLMAFCIYGTWHLIRSLHLFR